MFVLDWMTKEVVTVSRNDSIENLTSIMNSKKINHLPVVADKKLVGIITRSDIRQALTSIKFDKTKSRVNDFMTREVLTVKEYDTLEDVLLLIYDKKIGALPVTDNEAGAPENIDVMASDQAIGVGHEPGRAISCRKTIKRPRTACFAIVDGGIIQYRHVGPVRQVGDNAFV